MRFALALLLAACLPAFSHADLVVYTFSGVLPSGSTNHLEVSDGESFTATFLVNDGVIDGESDPKIGDYVGAVVSGTLSFSGGYISPYDFSGYNINVLDDVNLTDSVTASLPTQLVVFSVINNVDLNSLNSDELPGPGTFFSSDDSNSGISGSPQFNYIDDRGMISYTTSNASNTSFRVSVIPEPTSFVLILGTSLMAIGRRRRG